MLESAKIPCSRCQCSDIPVLRAESFDAYTGLRFTCVVSERGELILGSVEFDLEGAILFLAHSSIRPMYRARQTLWFVLMTSEVLNQKKKMFIFRRIGCGWVNHPSWLGEREWGFMVMI
jgi:hypothetical protein